IGRKIPGKKHRDIKDKQRFKYLAELELCTNTTSRNVDEQVMPKSLERIIKLKEAMKINELHQYFNTHNFLKKAFEKKNGIQIERDSNTSEIQDLTKYKHKDAVKTLKIKHNNINRKKILESSATLSKTEKRRLKICAKKEKKLGKSFDEFERLQDKIVFDEVVYESPRLEIKSNKINEVRKPKNLLNSLLEGSKESFFYFQSEVIDLKRKTYLKQKKEN
ncbi:hypothetical protein ALC56_00548, partial [Trachymyrmex septentrionalis]